MGFFSKNKKDVLDLTERFKEQQERVAEIREVESATTNEPSSGFGFLANLAGSNTGPASSESSTEEYADLSTGPENRKQRLAKRLIDMTDKLEEISNQIYHLQQRLEVLEKKIGVGSFD